MIFLTFLGEIQTNYFLKEISKCYDKTDFFFIFIVIFVFFVFCNGVITPNNALNPMKMGQIVPPDRGSNKLKILFFHIHIQNRRSLAGSHPRLRVR